MIKQAIAPTLWMLWMVETYALRPDTSAVMANLACAFLFTCFACMRGEQASNCNFGYEAALKKGGLNQGVVLLQGMVFREKSPKESGAVPRPFWMCIHGLRHGRAWFDRLLSTLGNYAGQRALRCVYLDYCRPGCGSSDPRRALQPRLNPLRGTDLQRGIQIMLVEACKITQQEAGFFTVHAGRHFLPYCAAGSGEPPDRAVEIGRWASSTAQHADLIPSQLRQLAIAEQLVAMPNTYSFPLKVERVGGILATLMRKARVAVSDDWDKLEAAHRVRGGFELLAQYSEAVDGI